MKKIILFAIPLIFSTKLFAENLKLVCKISGQNTELTYVFTNNKLDNRTNCQWTEEKIICDADDFEYQTKDGVLRKTRNQVTIDRVAGRVQHMNQSFENNKSKDVIFWTGTCEKVKGKKF